MSVTIADLQLRVETDLDDATLQRILDAAVKAVDRAAGKTTAETETKIAANSMWLILNRRSTGITTVSERRLFSDSQVTLAVDDYRKVGDYRILRLADGTNPARFWGSEVEIVYTPELDQEVRDRVALDLSQVDIEFRAYAEEKSGNWSGKADWKKERANLLRQIREGRSVFA